MKAGMNVQEFGLELRRQQTAKRDFTASTRNLQAIVETIGEDVARVVMKIKLGDKGTFGVSETGHTQFADVLKIPRAYYNRMLTDPFALPLLTSNVNHWLSSQDLPRMVRTLDGDIRAVLSNSYRVIDNLDVADAVLPVLAGVPDMRIESADITPNRMYIKTVFPNLKAEIRVGDIVTSGVVISNSEIGNGTAAIESMMYRLWCKNGAIRAVGVKRRHVGQKQTFEGVAEEILTDETRKARDTALFLEMRDVVKAATEEATFFKFVEVAKAAAGEPMNGSVPEVAERVARRFGLVESEGKSALDQLIQDGDLTQYGMANAVTRIAQDLESYDRSTDLERIGGQILELPRTEWRQLAMVA